MTINIGLTIFFHFAIVVVTQYNYNVTIIMPNITVRNIPEDIYEKIKQNAIANKRSINSEILYGLEQNYSKSQPDKTTILQNVRQLRAKTKGKIYLTEAEINRAKSEGRA